MFESIGRLVHTIIYFIPNYLNKKKELKEQEIKLELETKEKANQKFREFHNYSSANHSAAALQLQNQMAVQAQQLGLQNACGLLGQAAGLSSYTQKSPSISIQLVLGCTNDLLKESGINDRVQVSISQSCDHYGHTIRMVDKIRNTYIDYKLDDLELIRSDNPLMIYQSVLGMVYQNLMVKKSEPSNLVIENPSMHSVIKTLGE